MVKWKTAVYLRLSVDDGQKAESNSIFNQKEIINNYAKKEKDIKIVDYYIDDGYTGTDFERPGFQRLLLDIKKGKINTIIVKDLSRLGRNYIEVGNYLEQIFPFYNIRFIAINDNIDSFKDPKSSDNIIVPVKNLMNDEYARDISNKVRSVLNIKKEKGEFIGSLPPYGYLRNPNNKYKFIIDKEASKVVKKIFRMILNGHSKKEVIDELNKFGILPPRLYQIKDKKYNFDINDSMKKWDRFKIDKILKNKTYIGYLIQSKKKTISHKIHKVIENKPDNWVIIKNHHESIITNEEFEQVQDIIYNRDIKINKNKKYDVFSGHIKCADCGNALTIFQSKKYEYYYCASYMRKKSCLSNHSIKKEILNEIVLKMINKQIELVKEIDNKIENIVVDEEVNYDIEILNNRIVDIDNHIVKYKKLKNDIRNDYIGNFIKKEDYTEYEKEYDSYLKQYVDEKNVVLDKLNNIDKKSSKNKFWIYKYINNSKIEKLSKKIVDELIEDIIVYKNRNIKIIFKYNDEYNEALDFINSYQCDIIGQEIYAN